MTHNLLVLWNIDLTLVDVARVTRAAYAEAFATVAGRPLVHLPQMAGRGESEVFFDALALNDADTTKAAERLLEPFSAELARAMRARQDDLKTQGHLLPGAADALKATQDLAVQTVLTGSSKPNAMLKLAAFGLDRFIDFEVGGYGSEAYPKGTSLRVTKERVNQKYRTAFGDHSTVYIGDSPRDVDAARVGGARSIGVASGRATAAELRDAGAGAVLADLTDSQALLRLLVM